MDHACIKRGKKKKKKKRGRGIGKGRNLSEAGGTKRNNLLSSRPKERNVGQRVTIWTSLKIW